jgi:uncharacterized membrane protein YhaH (DUF805 family)
MIGADSTEGGAVLGGLVLLGIFCIGFWAGLALIIKRLHDMGVAGTQAIWIYCLNAASGALVVAAPALSIPLSIATFGVALWLLFGAGQPHSNQYGPVPGTATLAADQPSRSIA